MRNCRNQVIDAKEKHKEGNHEASDFDAVAWGAPVCVVARKALQWGWSREGPGQTIIGSKQLETVMTSSAMKDKPFKIELKRQVYKAYKAVKSNQGAAGVDGFADPATVSRR